MKLRDLAIFVSNRMPNILIYWMFPTWFIFESFNNTQI